MVLPFRAKTALDAGQTGVGFHELCDVYGRMIGHRYSDLAAEDEGKVRRFSNISLPEACATSFNQGLSRFSMSNNQNGLDLVIVSMPECGSELIYEQRGSAVVARNGDAIIHATSERLVSHTQRVAGILAVALPRRTLAALARLDDCGPIGHIAAENTAFRLFRSYASSLLTLENDPDFHLADRIGDQLAELLALAIGASRHGQEVLHEGTALADARFHHAELIIKRHLSEPELNEAHIARALRVSPSTLRQVFARRGLSVASFIREARLARAHAMLSGADGDEKRIVDIAADCGFNSMSAFYAGFRAVYGCSPKDIRGSL